MRKWNPRRRLENRRKINSLRGKASGRAKDRKRLSEAAPTMFAMTVRVYYADKVRQVILHTDGLYVWHQGGKTRTYEAFCKAMNRKLWKRLATKVADRRTRGLHE